MRLAIETRYAIRLVSLARVDGGTATHNVVVSDGTGRRWFAKVYRAGADLGAAEGAIALSRFAREGGLPVPVVHPTRDGDVLARVGDVTLSLWDFVDDAETAEGGLTGRRWESVGRVTGLLHHRLGAHPAGGPSLRPASEFLNLWAARRRYDGVIAAYRARDQVDGPGGYQAWALEAAVLRRSLLPRVTDLLGGLAELTVQVVHGDLAAPNVLMRGDEVAAIVDFEPAHPAYMAWEIARIACDPRTLVADTRWAEALPRLLAAYREACPSVRQEDLDAVVALGCAYMLASTYPLEEPLKANWSEDAHEADVSLQRYGRDRHDAALLMLDHLGA